MQTDGADAHLPLLQQVHLVAADLFRAELIRGTMEMFGKGLHRVQVVLYGSLRVIATLEFFQHHLA